MLLATTTTPDRATADAIAAALVEKRLAACVQVAGPITSVYRWQGEIQTSQEWVCTAKTTVERWHELMALVLEMHPYQTPEIVATPIDQASEGYEVWVRGEVS